MSEAARPATPSVRTPSIDALRGAVIVLMALDHVRDFFSNVHYDPTDLDRTTPALFVTRVVTHFCAPVFCLLAGLSAYLSYAAGKPVRELSRFLVTRGAVLVLFELTVVHWGWTFDLHYATTHLQVIWALGWSMVVLGALVHLPLPVVGATGLALVLGHNLFDGYHAGGALWWKFLHEGFTSFEIAPGHRVIIIYPLIPWVGVMACGFALGPWLTSDAASRRARSMRLGLALLVAFVVMRAFVPYGDPRPFVPRDSALFTAFAFVNTTKYPPSLEYLLMTLGPAMLVLGALDRASGRVIDALVRLGRAPMFFYLLHLPFIHALAGAAAVSRYGTRAFSFAVTNLPADYGFGLPVVYAVWIGVVLALYPPCAKFAELKQRRRDLTFLTYL